MIHLHPGVNASEYHAAVNAALAQHSGKQATRVAGEQTLASFLAAVRPFALYIPTLFCVYDPLRRHITVTEQPPGPVQIELARYPGDDGPPPNLPVTRFDNDLATVAGRELAKAAEAIETLVDLATPRSEFDAFVRQALHQIEQAQRLVPAIVDPGARVATIDDKGPAQELVLSTVRMGAKPVRPE